MNFNRYAYKEFGTFIVFEKESLRPDPDSWR